MKNIARNIAIASALFVALAIASPAGAQTVLLSDTAPQKPNQTQSAAPPVAPAPPPTPLPESVAQDAIEHREGKFPDLTRRQIGSLPLEGGMIQHAWNDAPPAAGVAVFTACTTCVYKLRTRELMITTVILPQGTRIERADLGDPAGFEVEARAENILAIRPAGFGIDTNLNVYTSEGVFSFYIRSEGFNSQHVPDLVVRIAQPEAISFPAAQGAVDDEIQPRPQDDPALIETDSLTAGAADDILGDLKPQHQRNDFLARVEFDPGNLHGFDDYELWGDIELKPARVFRDDFFTYIQFGDRWDSVELPVAFVVVDEIDEQVNTRVQGRTYIIESTSRLITLKSGTKFICIKYGGEGL